MSKFFEALERAEREQARRVDTAEPVAAEPVGVAEAPPPAAERRREAAATVVTEPYPDAAEGLSDHVDDHLIGLLAPNAPEAEHYRRLCQLLRERQQQGDGSVIAVSSPASAEGKTTTAINVAGLLAHHADLRVLLVETDLRAPSVAQQLGLFTARGRGLTDVLTHSTTTLESVTAHYRPLNLRFVPAGDAFGHPYDLISSPRFGQVLTQARHSFDHVIVDAPPLIPYPDCRLIAPWVDAFVIVVGAHRTPRRLLEESLTTLEPAKILGLLFNGVDGSSSQYSSRRENGTSGRSHPGTASLLSRLFGRTPS